MTSDEIQAVLEKHALWLKNDSAGAKANLVGANLRGAYLAGANLAGANLVGAYLEGANLVGANLVGANLVGASLGGANLAGASLRGANLRGANLRGASLRGAKFDRDTTITLCPITITGLSDWWSIVITDDVMCIGCQRHLIQAWSDFSEEDIAGMHESALDWWRDNRDMVLELALAHQSRCHSKQLANAHASTSEGV